MKKVIAISLVLLLAVFSLPLIFINTNGDSVQVMSSVTGADNLNSNEGTENSIDENTKIKVKMGEDVTTMTMHDYLIGVVSDEIPPSFPDEALKAQCVASRTLAAMRMQNKNVPEHSGADICTNPGHCEAYISIEEAKTRWGDDFDIYRKKIKNAVEGTDGEIIMYNNKPIAAVFHAASSGVTERAQDVWGNEIPYLQSVESMGESDAPRYYGRTDVEPDDFSSKLKKAHPELILDKDVSKWFGEEIRSTSGGIIEINIGNTKIKGSEIRGLFNLNSTNFTVDIENSKLVFRTIGYGHGVGLSQYGANAMALKGENYKDILKWYYTGVEIGKFSNK